MAAAVEELTDFLMISVAQQTENIRKVRTVYFQNSQQGACDYCRNGNDSPGLFKPFSRFHRCILINVPVFIRRSYR